jgi:hypothetical protein
VRGRRDDDPGVIWEGLVVLSSVFAVALVASVIRAVVDGSSNPLLAAFAAIVGGTLTYVALRAFFYRPAMPIQKGRVGQTVKDLAMLGGPPGVALVAALFAE